MSDLSATAPRRAADPADAAPARLRLLDADPQQRARWDAFVLACPQATFFHRAGWQTVIEQAFGHRTWFYYVEQGGQIRGVLPLAQVRSRLFGHALTGLPFCVYGGVAALDAAAGAMLEAAAVALARQLRPGHLELRDLLPAPPDPRWRGKALYVTFRKEIGADNEANLNAIPRKQRAMVRKGMKCGLQGQVDDDVERFFRAYARSVHRLGTPVFSKRYFALLKQEFGADCEVRVIVRGSELVAGVLSFFFRDEVLPYYGGGMDVAREVAGNDFMYWDLMQASATRGCRIFDFGRSKLGTGAYDFKKNWGFTAQPLHYRYQLFGSDDLPDVNPLNPKYRLFIALWRRLPGALVNRLGPYLVKQLG